MGAQSKERKGSNFAAKRSGAIVQKPEGPNTYDLNIWLWPSGNHGEERRGIANFPSKEEKEGSQRGRREGGVNL